VSRGEETADRGLPALDELERWRPGLERADWMRRISAAHLSGNAQHGTAGRELFRALRALFELSRKRRNVEGGGCCDPRYNAR